MMRTLTTPTVLVVTLLFPVFAATAAQAQSTYTSSANGAWNDPATWTLTDGPGNPNGFPGPADTAIIDLETVTLTDNHTVGSLVLTGNPTLDGSANLTIENQLTWNAGTITGAGTIAINGATLFQNATKTLLGRTLELASNTEWTGASILMGDGAVIHNQTGQTFRASHEGNAAMQRTGTITTEPVFDNDGRFIKDVQDINNSGAEQPGRTLIAVIFDHGGTASVVDDNGTAGTTDELEFGFGGTATGRFSVAADALLDFSGSQHYRFDGAAFEAPGEVRFSLNAGTRADFTGRYTYRVTGTTRIAGLINATVSFPADGTVEQFGALVIEGGTVDFSSGATISPETYRQSGGVLEGTDAVTVSGATQWDGGTIQGRGPFTAGAPATFGLSMRTLTGKAFALAAGGTWSGGSFLLGEGAVFHVPAGTTLRASHEGNAAMQRTGPITTEPLLAIDGSVVKHVDDIDGDGAEEPGLTILDVLFEVGADARLDVQQGEVRFTFEGTNHGLMTTAAEAEIAFEAAFSRVITHAAGGTLGGEGVFDVDPDFANLGTTAPGRSPGALVYVADFNSPFDMSVGQPVLEIELGGTVPGTGFDQLQVVDFRAAPVAVAKLGGTLAIRLIDGFTPRDGDAFVILTAEDGVEGRFATIHGLEQGGGTFAVEYNPTDVRLLFGAAPTADLHLRKTGDPSEVDLGGQVTFTVTLTNQGPGHATSVAVTEALTSGLGIDSFTASSGTSFDAQRGIWTVGQLNHGASATLEIVATTTEAGRQTNTATITAAGQRDDDNTDNEASAVVTVRAVDLSISKTVEASGPQVGEEVTFAITVANSGAEVSDATGVEIQDRLPQGLTFVSATDGGTFEAGTNTVTWSLGTIAARGQRQVGLVANVTGAGQLTNTVSITAFAPPVDLTPEDNTATATITVAAADLSVEKTVDESDPDVGATVVFTLTVANNGPDDATGVTLDDDLPAGLSFVSFNPVTDNTDTYDPNTGIITIGNLGDGQSATVEIVAQVTQTGTITNTVTVDDLDQVDDNASNDTDSVTLNGQQIDLELAKSVDDATPNVGAQIIFSLNVTNNGPSDATSVAVEDVLPAGLIYVSDNGGNATTENNGTITWTVGTLAAGGSATLEITAAVDQPGPQTNVAQVTAADQPDADSAPNNDDGDQSEDDEDNATVTATQPSACSSLVISDFSAAPRGYEFVDFTNEGSDTADLSQCVGAGAWPQTNTYYVVFDFPDTATLAPGEIFRFGAAGVVEVDLVIPDGSIQNTNAALALLERTSLAVGTPVAEVQHDVITALVYFNENDLFGFFHRDAALQQGYCTRYQGRLAPHAQEQCAAPAAGRGSLLQGQALLAMVSEQAEGAEAAVPETITLAVNYPNPFNPNTTIHFALPEASTVRLVVYDALGRPVGVLVDGPVAAGRHAVSFEGQGLSSGVYFYRLEAGGRVRTQQMLLMK